MKRNRENKTAKRPNHRERTVGDTDGTKDLDPYAEWDLTNMLFSIELATPDVGHGSYIRRFGQWLHKDTSGHGKETGFVPVEPSAPAPRTASFDRDGHRVSVELTIPCMPDPVVAPLVNAFERGDMGAMSVWLPENLLLEFVMHNVAALQQRGMFEKSLVQAWKRIEPFHRVPSTDQMAALFASADRQALAAEGDPLPGPGPFTVYRGIASRDTMRSLGLSWTASLDVACLFAISHATIAGTPSVWAATLNACDVRFYTNDRNEQEFVGLPATCRRLKLREREIRERTERRRSEIRANNDAWLGHLVSAGT